MAIDTLEKRASTIAVSFYCMSPSVQADGTIDLEDRQIAGYGYSGIAADAPFVFVPRVFHIVDPWDVVGGSDTQMPTVRPVRVRIPDVLSYLGLTWGWA